MSDEGQDRQKREERASQAARFTIGEYVLVAALFPIGTAGVVVGLPETEMHGYYVVDLGSRHVQCAEQDLRGQRLWREHGRWHRR